MKEKLNFIAFIASGFTFREKIRNEEEGQVYAIQLKDIANDFSHIIDYPHKVYDSGFSSVHLLQKGDILFIAKGQNNFAILYDKEYPKAVASSIFFVIRPNPNRVNSEYLTWYINQSVAQAFLHKGKEGTLITNINKQTLGELPIDLPSMEVQIKIARIAVLSGMEQRITKHLMEKKKLLIERLLLNKIQL